VIGLGGCGAYTGDFSLDANRLTIANLAATHEQCSESEQALQRAFLESFANAQSVVIRGGRMMLTTASGDLLIFALENDLPLEGPVWTLIAAAPDSDGAMAPILPDAPVSARFGDGAVMGALGCNLYEATYTLVDGLAVTNVQRMGDAVCDAPAGVMAQEEMVLALFDAITRYRVVGRELFLYGDTDEPLFVFYAAP
jgi:heat shock protein HslJ